MSIYDGLIASGKQPNAFVINALIGTCRQCGEPGRALSRLLDDIDRFGVALNQVSIHLMTAACAEARDWQSAKRLLAKMEQATFFDIVPTMVDCGQLAKALVSNKSPREGVANAVIGAHGTVGHTTKRCHVVSADCSMPRERSMRKLHQSVMNSHVDIDSKLATRLIAS